jgi:hypothetical protein
MGRLTAVIIATILVAGCMRPRVAVREPCRNRVLESVPAPGGSVKAVIFERHCQAPTGYSTQVSLVGAADAVGPDPGNVFIAGNGGRIPRPRSFVTVAWSGPARLTVNFEAGAAVFKAEPKVGGVEIAYARHQ